MKELKYRPCKWELMMGIVLLIPSLWILALMVQILLDDWGQWGVAGVFILLSVALIVIACCLIKSFGTRILFKEEGFFVSETCPKGQQVSFQWTDFCCACRMTNWQGNSCVVLMPQYDIGKAKAALKRALWRVIVDGMVLIEVDDEEVLHLIQSKLPYRVVKI